MPRAWHCEKEMTLNLSLILIIVGALVYLLAGYREGGERVGELGRICFFAGLLALVLK